MSIWSDTTDKQIDTTGIENHLFIVLAFFLKISSITIQDMHIFFLDVDMIKEVTSHERVIALRMFLGQSHILVHIEGDHILERYLSGTIGLDEVTVNAPVGSRVYLCSHTDGSHSIIKDYPKHGTYPVVLFTDRKRPKDNTDEATIVRF